MQSSMDYLFLTSFPLVLPKVACVIMPSSFLANPSLPCELSCFPSKPLISQLFSSRKTQKLEAEQHHSCCLPCPLHLFPYPSWVRLLFISFLPKTAIVFWPNCFSILPGNISYFPPLLTYLPIGFPSLYYPFYVLETRYICCC